MPDIDAIHARIDDRPEDMTARLVLADALEESEDPDLVKLAPGYRALAWLGRYPLRRQRGFISSTGDTDDWWSYHNGVGRYIPRTAGHLVPSGFEPWNAVPAPAACQLPVVWFQAVAGRGVIWLKSTRTRREIEDQVAAAFAVMTGAVREKILKEAPCERQPT